MRIRPYTATINILIKFFFPQNMRRFYEYRGVTSLSRDTKPPHQRPCIIIPQRLFSRVAVSVLRA